MIGESVTVRRLTVTGRDAFNNPVEQWADETVSDVLVAPSTTDDNADSVRPDGTVIDIVLHFPNTYAGASLRGCKVVVRGREYAVVGDPIPYTAANCPTRWNMKVEAARADG